MNSTLIAGEQIQFAMDNDSTCFAKDSAELYGVTAEGQFVLIAKNRDVYELLDGMTYNLSRYSAIAIHTTGWASPLNEHGDVEGAPSEHPDRRRVAVIVVHSDEGQGSAVAFADSEEIMTDEGEAQGSLSESIRECWERGEK